MNFKYREYSIATNVPRLADCGGLCERFFLH